ncbi:MAG: carboxylesterase family protein [Deltaproteobacteria bacterium]|nr:carboxylesterase family protein [Deltaproteobacteria bacterium]
MDIARYPRLRRLALLTVALAAATPVTARAQGIQSGTSITLADGQVQGHLNGAAREFLGIPYAAPPVGARRWRPPVPNAPWAGALDASSYPPACAQLDALTSDGSESEDCLYLNVWTPDPAPAEPLPVMVWIHGGGDVAGASGNFVPFPPYESYRLYDAHNLAGDRGVVVVSMNYRLGVLGFFGHAALTGEDPGYPYAGNQGLLDQRLALEWVRDNILAFGGDPANVTIFGESAGAWNVCAHVASPGSSGLFHRAISESGGCTVGIATGAESAARAADVTAAVGCGGAPDVLACLRAAPVAALLDAFGDSELDGTPISIDGAFLPAHPRTLFDRGAFSHVPYMLGFNSDEGTLFFIGATPLASPAEYTAALTARYGALAPQVEAVYPVTSFPTPQDAFVRVVGDATLVCPTVDVARRVSAAKNPRTYVYNFARVIPLAFVNILDLGAFHGAEIPYVFNSVPAPNFFDAQLGSRMQEYWTSFARKGRNPGAAKSAAWPRFKERPWRMLRFDAPELATGITRIKHFRRAECEFWSSVYDTIE